jgi:gliding motility-associated-like protein
MKTLRLVFAVFFLFALKQAQATHLRAGEIYYTRIAPFFRDNGGIMVPVYRYSITVVKYTDDGPNVADRCVDTLYFGDGDKGIAPRINGGLNGCNNCQTTIGGTLTTCGEIIISESGFRVKKNVYNFVHEYPGAGSYLIRSFDRNRNAGVKNIPNSINQPFYLEAFLVINSFTGANSSPVFNYAPIDRGCVGQCFEHNPGAYDPDPQDSLSYEIDVSRGEDGNMVPNYFFPPTGSGGLYGINSMNGLLRWCKPLEQGEYNIAFRVKEWRKNTSGNYVLIGSVFRDMQVIVKTCPNNDPPVIIVPRDTCVEAGAYIESQITVTDPNGGTVTIVGASGAMSANVPKATLSPTTGLTFTNAGYVSIFRWQTSCEHIKNQPYITTFKAQDAGNTNSDIKLVSFNSYAIRIVPPAVKNVTASPEGSTIKVTWDLSTCSPTSNPMMGYHIYRKNDCNPFTFDACNSAIPDISGYVLIGETATNTATFTDSNAGDGLVVGQSYSYLVVAYYADGTQSYGGTQICTKLKRDAPVILQADILSTSTNLGEIQVKWSRPLLNAQNLDPQAFPGPYTFNLKHRNASGNFETIYSSTNTNLALVDTAFKHINQNTKDIQHEYFVEFLSGTVTVGNSQKATSIFLNALPTDRRVDLQWSAKTPWKNSKYSIYRKGPGSSTFTLLATTANSTYIDTLDVTNKSTYCYKVLSEGQYSDITLPKPLLNNSQETCVTPLDMTPPCTPTITMDADCLTGFVKVSWTNVQEICHNSDDAMKYYLYFKSDVSSTYSLVAVLNHGKSNEYLFDGLTTISGCYAVQAVDSNNNVSPLSPDFCVDNCPEFELPNIFTPNGDAKNDFFKAIKVRQISEIDLSIYDRWGALIYKTKDPYFKWDGQSIISNQLVSDGVLFYTCDVFEKRLKGIVKRNLKGTVHLVR